MPCLSCGCEDLIAKVKISWDARFVERHGTVRIGGVKITQLDIKEAWDNKPGQEPKKLKGPIVCTKCKAEHVYYTGDDQPPLRLGKYARMRKLLK